jgi:uncharacterized membrane protein
MEAWIHLWLSLLLRWAHFITGVAWIGASFYFNWLENQLERRVEQDNDPVAGDLWAVHGGGFYYLQKFRLAPAQLPETLHWFKYEAYFTWLTGFALLAVVYYWNASLYMLDPAVSSLTGGQAVGIGLGSLITSWLLYDGLCRSVLRSKPRVLSLLIFVWFVLLAYVLGEFLSGRAAYIHVGAAIGTVMVANVFFVIIPSQKDLVSAVSEDRVPDATKAENALLRSRHNNYLTLPVLFIMISNHYPVTYGGPNNWLTLAVFSLAAVGIRHWFNIRHIGNHNRWILPLSVLVLVLLVLAGMPMKSQQTAAVKTVPTTAEIMPLVEERCTGCHSSQPTLAGFTAPPLGLAFDDEQQVKIQAQRIYQTTVSTRTMPLGNLTTMTEQERDLVAAWYQGQVPE